MPYPERLERDVRRGHALRRSGLVPLLSLSQSSQHEIYCFPRGRVIYTLRVCYDYHIIKYSRRYKTGARLLLYTFPSSLCIGSQKKKEKYKVFGRVRARVSCLYPFAQLLPADTRGGGGRKVHICSTLPAFACCRRAAPILCRTTDNWMFLSIYYFFAAWLLTLQQKDQLRLPASLREMFDGIDPAASVWQAAGDSVGLFSAFSSCYMAGQGK